MARMAGMMLSCEESSFLVSKSLEQKLTFKERINLRMHLLSCKFCLRYMKDIKVLDDYLKSNHKKYSHHQLNRDEKERIESAVLKNL